MGDRRLSTPCGHRRSRLLPTLEQILPRGERRDRNVKPINKTARLVVELNLTIQLKHGDYRVVPDLYSPESSHRWFGIIVGEKAGNYSQRLRRALTLARLAVVLLPFAFFASVALLGNVRTEATENAGSSQPAVTIRLQQ